MTSRTQRGRGRGIAAGAMGTLFPSAEFVRTHCNPERGRSGLIELLGGLNYPTTDADEAGLASPPGQLD